MSAVDLARISAPCFRGAHQRCQLPDCPCDCHAATEATTAEAASTCDNCGSLGADRDCPLCELIAAGLWNGPPVCSVSRICRSCHRHVTRNLSSDQRALLAGEYGTGTE